MRTSQDTHILVLSMPLTPSLYVQQRMTVNKTRKEILDFKSIDDIGDYDEDWYK